MNITFKKIIKGTIAIFAIKLILVVGIFIFQSCQSENINNSIQEEAKTNFLASLRQTNENLNAVSIRNPKNDNGSTYIARDMKGETETVCLMEFSGTSSTTDVVNNIVDNIDTVTELIQTKTTYNLVMQFDLSGNGDGADDDSTNDTTDNTNEPDYNPEDCIALIEIPIQPIADALDPTIQEAKNYLYSNGFNDSDIAEVLDNNNEGYLISAVSLMIATENSNNISSTSMNHINFLFGVETVKAQNWTKIGGCARKAFGLDLIDDFRGWKSLKKKARKKLVKKALATAGAKYAGGWFGAAVIVTEFALCMA